MIKLLRIAFGWLTAGTDSEVVVTTSSGLKGIAAHPETFTDPVPPLATVQTALDQFMDSIAVAAVGGPVQTAVKNAKRVELAVLVRPLCNYVSTVCNGDMAKLLSSGLPVQNPNRSRLGPLPQPSAPTVTDGITTGTLNVATSPINGAGIYNWQLALASAPTTVLKTDQTPGARTSFDGLTPGQVYCVRVNAVGAAGQSDWSDDGSTMVT